MRSFGQFGNSESGASVAYDDTKGFVRVDVWGFLLADSAQSLPALVAEACRSAPPPLYIMVDASRLVAQGVPGQQVLTKTMQVFQRTGAARVAMVASSALTRIQLKRLAKEIDALEWAFVASEADARATFPNR